MLSRRDLRQIQPFLFEIPKELRRDMRVPARIYADEEILRATLQDRSLEQLINVATLPGIVGYSLAMPDIHQGYGFPVGGVAATDVDREGVISPGGIGYDINCGVRLLASNIDRDEIEPHLETLARVLFHEIPSGVGQTGHVKLNQRELERLMEDGGRWALANGFATEDDLDKTEERGRFPGADPEKVSPRAKERGRAQVGSLGAGNHFVEVQVVDRVLWPEAADAMGLGPGQVTVLIHSGSRGFGHQVCTDYVRDFQRVVARYGIELPDRELVCAPFESPEGRSYFAAMACAANFAFANRQLLAHWTRQAFEQVLAGKVADWGLRQVYDIAHNMGKLEEYAFNGGRRRLCVHRKGATRAFGPGNPVLPQAYLEIGQPVLVPGSMGTASYVLCGQKGAEVETFGSSCHGAGRRLSRTAARKKVQGAELRQELRRRGIYVEAGSLKGIAEEAPLAYKDVDQVVRIVEEAGIARRVARLLPLAVVKG